MQRVVFGEFELDPLAYELRRRGRTVRLERLPMELLLLLTARRGELVTRAEIVDRLWGKDVFIDVDNGVNTIVRKLRQVLHEAPERPRFLQTVTGKGYRFLATARTDGRGASERLVLAVLPFRNLTGEVDQDYLVDGFTEETIAILGALSPQEMAVIARTSVMAYRQTTKTISTIAKELGASVVLEGSVRREGSRLRVTAQLIRAADQTQMWSDSYDQSVSTVIEMQQTFCQAIAERVHVHLSPSHASDIARRHDVTAGAYDEYLRGRYLWNQRTGPAVRRAIEHFRRAQSIAPGYALALAGVADAMSVLPIAADRPSRECLPEAKAASEAAISLNDGCSEAYAALAACKFWMEWDWPGAEAAASTAIALQPNFAHAHMIRGHILSNAGRHADAEAEICEAIHLDPVSSHLRTIFGQLLFQAGRWKDAAAQVEQALVLNPHAWIAHIVRGRLLIQARRLEEVHDPLQKAFELSDGNTEALSLRGYAYGKANEPARARQIIAMLQDIALHRYVPPYNVAMVFAGLNDVGGVIEWLGRAHEERDARLVFLAVDPKWSEFLADPRVEALRPDRLSGASTR